jgi:hypothetical protein
MKQRECPVCRIEFTPTHHNQRFCPPSDDDRARVGPNTQPRSRCAKRAENAKRNGGWDPSSRPLAAPFDCEWCGKPCIPGSDVSGHATRFCSVQHKNAWHKEHVEAKRLVVEGVTAEAGPHCEAAYREAMRHDPCAYCGKPGGTVDHIEPRKPGGADDVSNLTGACAACNNAKFTLPMLFFLGYKQARDYWRPWQEASAAGRRLGG